MEMSMQKKAFTGNARPPPREDIRIEHQKKENGGSSLFRDSLGQPPGTIGLGKLELKLAFAMPSVRRTKREGHVLVAFFGDSSYGWFDLAELVPFDSNYAEKSRQANMRTFVKAVEEAVDEASRRCALALACRCRKPYNFRPSDVQGYFAVDVGDNEPAGVYSMTQIRKSRESFRSRDVIAFAKQLALTPRGDGHGSFEFIKNKATIMAYRKAVFEEFDETYGQAFGTQPERPNREPMQAVTQPARGIVLSNFLCVLVVAFLFLLS